MAEGDPIMGFDPSAVPGVTAVLGGNPPAARLYRIRKAFPGVVALDDVSVDVRRGEIHALIGENGAGKSTLVRILAGLLRPDGGRILLDEREVTLQGPRDAQRRGISYTPQEVLSVPGFSVGRNMLLGFERPVTRKNGLTPKERAIAREALDRCGAAFSESRPTNALSVPELRLAQIARTLLHPGDVVLLDEPTAVLSESDATALLQRLQALRDQGKAIIYVSHRLSEVLEIATRITVLRDGHAVGTFVREEVDKDRIVALMVKPGQLAVAKRSFAVAGGSAAAEAIGGGPLMEIEGLTRLPHLRDVSLTVRAGEVVGVAGVQGSGHGHLLQAIAGIDPYDSGRVVVRGRAIRSGSLRSAYRAGVVLLPADRRRSAIVAQMPVRANLVLPVRSRTKRYGVRLFRAERAASQKAIETFSIRTSSSEALAGNLSGGNQQKLALARALESKPAVLLLEEPTQGIDVGAKAEILALVRRLVQDLGIGAIVATSEFEELLTVADAIHVMCLGQLVTTLPAGEATYERILRAALP